MQHYRILLFLSIIVYANVNNSAIKFITEKLFTGKIVYKFFFFIVSKCFRNYNIFFIKSIITRNTLIYITLYKFIDV